MSFPFPVLTAFSHLSSPSLSHWLPLSIQLISNRLYWHDWGILMMPKLYKKRKKNMLHLCLSCLLHFPGFVHPSGLSASVQTPQPAKKTQTISFLSNRTQPLLCLGLLSWPSVSALKQMFNFSFLLEMTKHQNEWIGVFMSEVVAIPLVSPPLCFSFFRIRYFTIFCRLQSYHIIWFWICSPGAVRAEAWFGSWFQTHVQPGIVKLDLLLQRSALLHTDKVGMDWARAEV